MISKHKKRIEISLSTEDEQLLQSLSLRFHITKSEVIRQALKVFAAKRKHTFKVYIKESSTEDDSIENQVEDNRSFAEILGEETPEM